MTGICDYWLHKLFIFPFITKLFYKQELSEALTFPRGYSMYLPLFHTKHWRMLMFYCRDLSKFLILCCRYRLSPTEEFIYMFPVLTYILSLLSLDRFETIPYGKTCEFIYILILPLLVYNRTSKCFFLFFSSFQKWNFKVCYLVHK